MNIVSIPVAIMVALCFYVGATFLRLYIRRRDEGENLAFALICFSITVYDICTVGLYNASSIPEAVHWQRFQLAMTAVFCASTAQFANYMTNGRFKKPLHFLAILYLLFFLLDLVVRNEWTLSAETVVLRRFQIGSLLSFSFHEGKPGLISQLQIFCMISGFFYVIYLFWRLYREGNRNIRPVLIFFALFFVGVLNDFLIVANAWQSIYLVEYVSLFIILSMAHSLQNKFLDLHAIVEELNRNLEKKVEKRTRDLQESEEKYRNLIELAGDGIALIKGKHLEYANPHLAKMVGRRPEEVVHTPFLDYIAEEEFSKVMGFFNKRIRGSADRFRYETALKHRNGKRVDVEISAGLIPYQGALAELVIIGDVTERNRERAAKEKLEKELAVSKKMEALGLLAGGVAHDLNNVLSGIVSYPELLLMDGNLDESIRKSLEVVKKSGARAAAIVEDLLTVARGVADVRKVIDLNRVVKDYFLSPEFAQLRSFHPSVKFGAAYDERPMVINASMVHIGKVLMNLTSNAAEAFSDKRGGVVGVSTRFEEVATPLKGWNVIEPGAYAVLSISDDGPGISTGDMERIFEPFYSKKVMGRSGTGLGLTVVWNTMQDHKGQIDIISDSRGTTFDLYFPLVEKGEPEAEPAHAPIDYRGNGESILIVDDVEEQRLIAGRILETLGYRTTAVSSGEEAAAYLIEASADLLVLDMIMEPGMNGREAYERILELHPGQKAVISSGYSETDDVKKTMALGAGVFIKKPYSVEKIGLAVKKALGRVL